MSRYICECAGVCNALSTCALYAPLGKKWLHY